MNVERPRQNATPGYDSVAYSNRNARSSSFHSVVCELPSTLRSERRARVPANLHPDSRVLLGKPDPVSEEPDFLRALYSREAQAVAASSAGLRRRDRLLDSP